MMTEMDDPMVLESLLPYPKDLDRSVLAARAREMQEVVLENGAFEISIVDSPASGEVTDQVVGMESSPPALTYISVGDDMSKHGDGAQSEAAQEQELALPTKSSEGGRVIELPFESSTFSSPNSRNLNDIAGEGTGMAQKKCRNRGKNWAKLETDDLLRAVLNTRKVCTRMEQGTASDSHWDAIAKAVPGRTGHECRGRMDTLKRSFSAIKKYWAGQGKEFKQLNEKDFVKMKVSPQLTEAWYNQIRDNCPPRPKKKLKTNGAGSSSKSTGLVQDISTLGLQPPVVPDGIDQIKQAMVEKTVARGSATSLLQTTRGDDTVCGFRSPLPLQDPPGSQLELPVADPLQRQAPPAPQLCDDSVQALLSSFEDSWFNTDLALP